MLTGPNVCAFVDQNQNCSVVLVLIQQKLTAVCISGGFSEFCHLFPGLCEGRSSLVPACISQPCLPVSSTGPTRILPHLYLGCQRDVLNKVTQTVLWVLLVLTQF